MHRPQQQVHDFHKLIDAPTSPAEPMIRQDELRASLILEEALETAVALLGGERALKVLAECVATMNEKEKPNFIEAIDGLCDTIVVCYGTAEAMGIDLEPFYDEVMRANCAKVGGPIRADGKRGKPPGWTPPDIAGVLERTIASYLAEEGSK